MYIWAVRLLHEPFSISGDKIHFFYEISLTRLLIGKFRKLTGCLSVNAHRKSKGKAMRENLNWNRIGIVCQRFIQFNVLRELMTIYKSTYYRCCYFSKHGHSYIDTVYGDQKLKVMYIWCVRTCVHGFFCKKKESIFTEILWEYLTQIFIENNKYFEKNRFEMLRIPIIRANSKIARVNSQSIAFKQQKPELHEWIILRNIRSIFHWNFNCFLLKFWNIRRKLHESRFKFSFHLSFTSTLHSFQAMRKQDKIKLSGGTWGFRLNQYIMLATTVPMVIRIDSKKGGKIGSSLKSLRSTKREMLKEMNGHSSNEYKFDDVDEYKD